VSLILDWDIFQEEIFYWYTIILYEHFVCWKVLLVGPFFSCKILIKWQASTYSTYHRCMYSCPSIMSDTDNTKLVRIIESILAPTKQVLPLIVRANLAHELVTKIAHHISTQTQPSRAISLSSQPLQRLIWRSRFVRIQNTKRSRILHLSCNSLSEATVTSFFFVRACREICTRLY